MTWTSDTPEPEWLSDLATYQREQARLLELGIWPLETALRCRAISTTIASALATIFVESIHKRRQEGDLYSFPFISADDVTQISQIVMSAILAGSWLQQGRASDYLDNHPGKDRDT